MNDNIPTVAQPCVLCSELTSTSYREINVPPGSRLAVFLDGQRIAESAPSTAQDNICSVPVCMNHEPMDRRIEAVSQ